MVLRPSAVYIVGACFFLPLAIFVCWVMGGIAIDGLMTPFFAVPMSILFFWISGFITVTSISTRYSINVRDRRIYLPFRRFDDIAAGTPFWRQLTCLYLCYLSGKREVSFEDVSSIRVCRQSEICGDLARFQCQPEVYKELKDYCVSFNLAQPILNANSFGLNAVSSTYWVLFIQTGQKLYLRTLYICSDRDVKKFAEAIQAAGLPQNQ